MSKIVVFGAAGRAGRTAVHEALRRGHQVTGVLRDPARHAEPVVEGVVIVAGDVTDAHSVARVAEGHDAAISAACDMSARPDAFFVGAASALLDGLTRAGVGRLVVVGLASVLETVSGALLMDTPGYPQDYRAFYHGHAAGTEMLRTATTSLDWLVVSPAGDVVHDGAPHREVPSRSGRSGQPHLLRRLRDRTPRRGRRPPAPPHAPRHRAGLMEQDTPDSPVEWAAAHVRRFIETGGQARPGMNDLLLTTSGRKSGTLRRVVLVYARDDDRYVLAASNAGADTHPAWFLNLVENPALTVQIGPETFPANARAATSDEKPRLWQLMVATMPSYQRYQDSTSRDIPVVIIERAE